MLFVSRLLSKIKCLAIVFFIISNPGIFAQQAAEAVIREMVGTVEVKYAASETWVTASRGQNLALDTTISTGFRSTVVIAMGDSLITVRPLTRLTLTELSRNQDNEKVELNLQTGRVKADVKAPEGGKTEFVINSPNSTSSVRGTVFEFDAFNLFVREGTVEFKGGSGFMHLVDAGGYSQIDERTGRASPPTTGRPGGATITAAPGLSPELPIASDPIQPTPQLPDPVPDPVQPPADPPSDTPSNPPSNPPPYSGPTGPSGGGDGTVGFTPIF